MSSFNDSTSGPDKARLNLKNTTQSISTTRLQITAFNATMNVTMNVTTVDTFLVEHGGWIAADDDSDPWLQVDFRTNVTVTALATQGLDSGIAWLTNYTFAYGQHRDNLEDYKVDGKVKVCIIRSIYIYLTGSFKQFLNVTFRRFYN